MPGYQSMFKPSMQYITIVEGPRKHHFSHFLKHRGPIPPEYQASVHARTTSKMAPFSRVEAYNRTSVGAARQVLNCATVRAFFSLLVYEFCLLSSWRNRSYH
ncbi:MAG: hypothetical protein ACYTBX_14200, partial [Planctomycetota bacterium]